jgi:SHS2 domain-containing protein
MGYEFLEHTADVKFRASGLTIDEMFKFSALAFFEAVRGKVKISENIEERISVSGKDLRELMYNFLEEFLFLFDSEGFVGADVLDLKVDERNLKIECAVAGDLAGKYEFANDVKAVTYSEMFVGNRDGLWVSQVVLDV